MTSADMDHAARIAAARDSTACRFEDVDEAWRFEDQVLDMDAEPEPDDTVWWIVLVPLGGMLVGWPAWCVVVRGL